MEIVPGDGSEWFSGESQSTSAEHAPFLFVESNLGVPQKVLYKAYVAAVPWFSKAKRALKVLKPTASGGHISTSSAEDLRYSSSVLLLANPAHQTALNARKSLVQHGLLDAALELRFTAALLHVRTCAKQSLLWHHRRWLLRRLYPTSPRRMSTSSDLRSSTVRDGEDTLRDLDAGEDRSKPSIARIRMQNYNQDISVRQTKKVKIDPADKVCSLSSC